MKLKKGSSEISVKMLFIFSIIHRLFLNNNKQSLGIWGIYNNEDSTQHNNVRYLLNVMLPGEGLMCVCFCDFIIFKLDYDLHIYKSQKLNLTKR